MSCGCPEWVVNTFICINCGKVFTFKHRDYGDPVVKVLIKNGSCPSCQSKNFKFLEKAR